MQKEGAAVSCAVCVSMRSTYFGTEEPLAAFGQELEIISTFVTLNVDEALEPAPDPLEDDDALALGLLALLEDISLEPPELLPVSLT